MRKLSVILTTITILLVVIYMLTIPTVKKLTGCLEQGTALITQISIHKQQENWAEQRFCEEDAKLVNQIISCYESAEQRGLLKSDLYFKLVGKKLAAKDLRALHNQACAKHPNTLIK